MGSLIYKIFHLKELTLHYIGRTHITSSHVHTHFFITRLSCYGKYILLSDLICMSALNMKIEIKNKHTLHIQHHMIAFFRCCIFDIYLFPALFSSPSLLIVLSMFAIMEYFLSFISSCRIVCFTNPSKHQLVKNERAQIFYSIRLQTNPIGIGANCEIPHTIL